MIQITLTLQIHCTIHACCIHVYVHVHVLEVYVVTDPDISEEIVKGYCQLSGQLQAVDIQQVLPMVISSCTTNAMLDHDIINQVCTKHYKAWLCACIYVYKSQIYAVCCVMV